MRAASSPTTRSSPSKPPSAIPRSKTRGERRPPQFSVLARPPRRALLPGRPLLLAAHGRAPVALARNPPGVAIWFLLHNRINGQRRIRRPARAGEPRKPRAHVGRGGVRDAGKTRRAGVAPDRPEERAGGLGAGGTMDAVDAG